MTRTDILNHLIRTRLFTRYLEIGLNKSVNFDRVNCEYKISVDPDPNCKATFCKTSDQYFKIIEKWDVKYDLVFIDGLHHSEQVERDADNSLKHLAPNGLIVCHDCNPVNEIHQRVPRESKHWNGNVWQAIVKLRHERSSELSIVTVDTDEGCAIIGREGKKYPFTLTRELTWENLDKHRKEWLNLISPTEFKKLYQ